MPTYTLGCTSCDIQDTVTAPMGAALHRRCPKCKKMMKRLYEPPQIINDTHKRPRRLAAVKSVCDPKNQKAVDVIESYSDEKKFLDRYEKVYGTKVTFD